MDVHLRMPIRQPMTTLKVEVADYFEKSRRDTGQNIKQRIVFGLC